MYYIYTKISPHAAVIFSIPRRTSVGMSLFCSVLVLTVARLYDYFSVQPSTDYSYLFFTDGPRISSFFIK